MDWFIERNGGREGPYNVAEIQTRVTTGAVPPTADVHSADGTLRMTAAALVAAMATVTEMPVASPPSNHPQSQPAPNPGRIATALHGVRGQARRLHGMEWAIGSTIIAGYALLIFQSSAVIAAIPVVASWLLIAADARRHRWSRLHLAKAPLSKMERWTTSTWLVSIGVLWPLFAPVYLFKRRRLLACIAELDSSGVYASKDELSESRRGVAGAAVVAEQSPRDTRDLLLQAGCLVAAVLVVAAAYFASPNSSDTSGGDSSAQSSSAEVDAIVAVMNADGRIDENGDVYLRIAAMDTIDISECPRDYRNAFHAYREAVRAWAVTKHSAIAAGNTPMNTQQREIVALVALSASAESLKKIREAYAEMLRVAKTYGVEYK